MVIALHPHVPEKIITQYRILACSVDQKCGQVHLKENNENYNHNDICKSDQLMIGFMGDRH
jgi:hypothetical protein